MSGGAWGYLHYRIDEESVRMYAICQLMAKIEHVLDWGISGNTCYACAQLRVIAALCAFFEGPFDLGAALVKLEGPDQPELVCPTCQERARQIAARRAANVSGA